MLPRSTKNGFPYFQAIITPKSSKQPPQTSAILALDCSDIYSSGVNDSGVYSVSSVDGPVQVYCHMVPTGQHERGHWTVILRRMDGEVNFFRPWDSYKQGFGNKEGEHWLGLEFMHLLTRRNRYKLKVDLEDFDGTTAYALYESFSVDSEADGYKLHISGFVNGGAGDSLSYHSGMKFSTFDKDQDMWEGASCALTYNGGFWYNNCQYTNPTGLYFWGKDDGTLRIGTHWNGWKNSMKSLKSITMKIRREM
ncbi:microfibril-associated glycoprotein 4-like [Rhinichthys klamathensis goyatoka]|uniref:microfibril-associated glycoprotein 4-like n=1 Tax=Rhinichthys klamathensis goyatoka TaxID=3034132 RepID=UPI0024B49028|nr:microfibril-associated glycoprotein 4-like [Rhinichthys klamathensis goyatoka]